MTPSLTMIRSVLVVVLALATALAVLASPARAAAVEPAVVTVTAPAVHAGEVTTVTVTVTAQDAPVVGGQVLVERSRDGVWVPVADATTDASGQVTATVALLRDPQNNRVRATVAETDQYGAASATYAVRLRKRDALVTLRGPDVFVDETPRPSPCGGARSVRARSAGRSSWYDASPASASGDGSRC